MLAVDQLNLEIAPGEVFAAALDSVLMAVGVRLFQRETILTRWR